MAAKDVLKEMYDNADTQAEGAEESSDILDTQIENLESQMDAIKTAMTDVIAETFETYIVGDKYSSLEYILYTGSLYNDVYDEGGVGNLTDWIVYKNTLDNITVGRTQFTYISSSSFSVYGDFTTIFPTSLDIAFGCRLSDGYDTLDYAVVSTSSYDTTTGETIVNFTGGTLLYLHNVIFISYATYNDPTDEQIDNFITQWEFGHDYIVHPLDSTGSYGLQDMRDKLVIAKGLMDANAAKYTESKTQFEPFI